MSAPAGANSEPAGGAMSAVTAAGILAMTSTQDALDATVKEIRRVLRARSGRPWSVTRDRGTAYGWINITAPASRRQPDQQVSAEDATELATLLGISGAAPSVTIANTRQHWAEYVDRANGRTPSVRGRQYWD